MLDVLIVGQGLAGSVLAWILAERGLRLMVVDPGEAMTTSRAAAGLVNPITGQRFVRTQGIESFLPKAYELYSRLEAVLGRRLWYELPMRRLFRSSKEAANLARRRRDPDYADYLGSDIPPGVTDDGLNAPWGGVWQSRAGYLDTCALLDGLGDWFRQRGLLEKGRVEPADLVCLGQSVAWCGRVARHVVFCEGHAAAANPWFPRLPLTLAKGEILDMYLDPPPAEGIVGFGKWLLPRADGSWKLGATYGWEFGDTLPTAEGGDELLGALNELFVVLPKVKVAGHVAGVRPATSDRRPLVGFHPQHPCLAIFNGFGSKGSLMIPWYAQCLADALQGKGALPADVEPWRGNGMALS